ncbi:acetyltransferase [Halothiobacillus sp.]|uniref:acetyltransferase n=1 Tax=Halothiobacillus sp. TaxID=1891311 RepID=UPI002634D1CC|nr:acetyltransferase [Halothiobacillus sp.]MDD4966483.1 acetyltransferase [Halothiobacillus sp.]
MTKPFIILGTGGHAAVIRDLIECLGHEVAGVLTPEFSAGSHWQGLPVLGADDFLDQPSAADYVYALGVGLMPNQACLRSTLYVELMTKGLEVPTLVHPSAVVARSVHLGQGVQILAGVVVQAQAVIGDNVLINTRASLDHHCHLGAHSHVAPGAVLCGGVSAGERVFVGAGAIVIQGVEIGSRAEVGAGATLLRSLPADTRFIPGHPHQGIKEK